MTTATDLQTQFDVTVALNRAIAADRAVRATKAILSKEEEALQAAVSVLELMMQERQLNAVGSVQGTAELVQKTTYNSDNWPALFAHIQKTGEFDLLYKRVNPKAAADRDSNGELPPGIRRFMLLQLKLKASE
jgi:hypothetical protein